MSQNQIDALMIRIKNAFTFHPAKDDQPERYSDMRLKCLELAHHIATETPPSREQSVALTKLEEVMFWANAAIARNE